MKLSLRLLMPAWLLSGLTTFAAINDSIVLPEDVFPQLKPIMDAAVTRSPRMILRSLDVEVAEGDWIQAKAGLMPSLSSYYQASKAKDVREDVSGTLATDKVYYNLTLSQPLFHWRERRNNARIGELRRHIAEGRHTEAFRVLALEIRSTYLQLILMKIRVANARNEQRLAEDALRLAEEKLAQKVTSEGEIFQTQIAHEKARLAAEYADLDFLRLKQVLASLTGQPVLADNLIPDEIAGLPSSLEGVSRLLASFLSMDEPDIPQMMILRREVEAGNLTYANQRKRLLPKLNFVAGVSQDEQSFTTNVGLKYGVQSRFAGLTVTWSIFDGHATRGAVMAALARKRQAEVGYQEFKDTIDQEVQRSSKKEELAFRQMQISNRMLVSANDFLVYREGDFKRGQASETDIASAQANYRNMVAAAAESRYEYLMRLAEFVSLVGAAPATANLKRPKA